MEKSYIYQIMDVTDTPTVSIGIFDKKESLIKYIKEYPAERSLSESFFPYDEKFEIWRVQKNIITLEYRVIANVIRILHKKTKQWETIIKEKENF